MFIIEGEGGGGRMCWAQNLPGDVRAGEEPVVEHCRRAVSEERMRKLSVDVYVPVRPASVRRSVKPILASVAIEV